MGSSASTYAKNILNYAGSGAGIGTALAPFTGGLSVPIGAGIGALGGLFSSIFGDDGSDEVDRQRKMWEDLAYQDPNSDPRYKANMDQLAQWSKGGLTDQDKAMLLRANNDASAFAHGREGAVRQDLEQRGAGGNAGLMAAMEAQASQGASNRMAEAGSEANSMADQRARQAAALFQQEMDKNMQQLNNFKLMKTQGMNAASQHAQDYKESQGAALNQTISGLGNSIAQIGSAYNAGKTPSVTIAPKIPNAPTTYHSADGTVIGPATGAFPEQTIYPSAPTAAQAAGVTEAAPSSLTAASSMSYPETPDGAAPWRTLRAVGS